MKAIVVALWAVSLLFTATIFVVAAFHPDRVTVVVAVLNLLVLFATTVVASWSRLEAK